MRGRSFVIFALSILLNLSCSNPPSSRLPPELPSQHSLSSLKDASLLGPGDVIEIRVYREPELSGLYSIDPNGAFIFPLIGEVAASQQNLSDLTSELTTRLKTKYLRDPQVTVILKEVHSKKIFVLGMVKKPGSYIFEPMMSVVQAIALAGGLQSLASKDLVLIREEDGREKKYHIPFKEISQGQAENSSLQPGDIIYVPESWY